MAGREGTQSAMSTLSSADEWLVRSIFFYNATPPVGAAVGLHFFEPRYRLLAVRALSEERQRQFVFLPNYSSYQAAHGDIGLLATITDYRPIGGSSTELPRADVELRFEARVLVLFHWVERETSGLHECLCVPIAEPKTPPSLACRFVSSLIWSVARPEPVGGGRGMRRYEVDPECAEGVGIFAEPSTSVPPLSTRLPAGAVVTVLDSAGEGLWFRHEAGWSKVEIALRPSWCLADELRRSHGIVVRHSSHNGYGVDAPNEVPDWHFLAYAPTAEGCELASSDLRDATPLSAALVFAMVVPDQSELVGVDSLITSLAAAYMTHRHGPPVADANAADADPMAMEELQEVLPKPSSVQADAVDPMVADVAQACNEVARSLRGMPVALVCGCPARGLEISKVEIATPSTADIAALVAPKRGQPHWGRPFSFPIGREGNPPDGLARLDQVALGRGLALSIHACHPPSFTPTASRPPHASRSPHPTPASAGDRGPVRVGARPRPRAA